MRTMADLIEKDRLVLAETMTLEMGKPVVQARNEVTKCVGVLRYYAEHGAAMLADERGRRHRREERLLHQIPADRPGAGRDAVELPALAGHQLRRTDLHCRQRRPLEACLQRALRWRSYIEDAARRAGFPEGVFQITSRWRGPGQGDPGGRPRSGCDRDWERRRRAVRGLHRGQRHQKDGARARRRRPVHRDAIGRHGPGR